MRKILVVVVAGILVSGGVFAATSFKGQGTIEFDKIKTKAVTVTGASNLMGDVSNTASGKPVKIKDNLLVTGTLTVGSFPRLSAMVSSAGFAKMTDLSTYAKTSTLSSYALSSTVSSLSDQVDIDWSWTNAIYEYNRCVLNLGQGYTYPAISEMTFCWDLWVGTSLTAGKASMETNQITDKMKLDSASKLQVESDRSAVVNSVK